MDQPPLDRCFLGPRPTLELFAAPPKAVIQNGLNETTGSSTDVAKKIVIQWRFSWDTIGKP